MYVSCLYLITLVCLLVEATMELRTDMKSFQASMVKIMDNIDSKLSGLESSEIRSSSDLFGSSSPESESSPLLSGCSTPGYVDTPSRTPSGKSHTPTIRGNLLKKEVLSDKQTDNKTVLLSPEAIIARYPRLLTLSKIGTLSVKLAKESYFGIELMSTCTVYGCRGKPALPKEILMKMKSFLLQYFNCTKCPEDFEVHWRYCVDAINHACNSMRKNCCIDLTELQHDGKAQHDRKPLQLLQSTSRRPLEEMLKSDAYLDDFGSPPDYELEL